MPSNGGCGRGSGFKTVGSARAILGGIEMIHMMRKQQAKYACNQRLSLADQFVRLSRIIASAECSHFFGSKSGFATDPLEQTTVIARFGMLRAFGGLPSVAKAPS